MAWRLARLLFGVGSAVAVAACISPESQRVRGGGPGADPQNRPAEVKMHEGSNQYWETPVRIESESEGPPVDPAQHARIRSLP